LGAGCGLLVRLYSHFNGIVSFLGVGLKATLLEVQVLQFVFRLLLLDFLLVGERVDLTGASG